MKTSMTSIAAILLGSGVVLGAFACATARPSPELLSAREAYQKAESGPATELNPADLHDAKVLLDAAEASGKENGESPVARRDAYLAQRRAELANAQGRTSAVLREKDQSQKQLQAIKDQSLVTAKGQLAQAAATQAQTQTELSRTQGQLDAEHQSHAQMSGQLADASAAQARTETELSQARDQVDSEHQARLLAEQDTLDALGKVAAVKREARGMVITLSGSVLFASGRSALLPSAQTRLDQVANALKADSRAIVIEGYTDSRGSNETNQQLSQSRAQSVMDYLSPRGVLAERIHAVGMGSTRPIAENNTAEGRANNRRVEIVLQDAQPARTN
jgi:outer membrane protein OmpA-like peptidoglycan-associated protein